MLDETYWYNIKKSVKELKQATFLSMENEDVDLKWLIEQKIEYENKYPELKIDSNKIYEDRIYDEYMDLLNDIEEEERTLSYMAGFRDAFRIFKYLDLDIEKLVIRNL